MERVLFAMVVFCACSVVALWVNVRMVMKDQERLAKDIYDLMMQIAVAGQEVEQAVDWVAEALFAREIKRPIPKLIEKTVKKEVREKQCIHTTTESNSASAGEN